MADNDTTFAPAVGPGVLPIASDDIGGIRHQRTKVEFGVDGSAVGVSATDPLPVTGTVAVTQRAGTSTLSNVTSSVTSVTVLAANPSRRGAYIYNESTAVLYLALAGTASVTAYTVALAPGDLYELPTPAYTGLLSGVWASADGFARVTEVAG